MGFEIHKCQGCGDPQNSLSADLAVMHSRIGELEAQLEDAKTLLAEALPGADNSADRIDWMNRVIALLEGE